MNLPWDARFLTGSPLFEPLRPVADGLSRRSTWPSLDDYRQLAEAAGIRPCTQSGIPVRFVPQGPKPRQFSDKYEPRIFLTGEVQTRTENWHDLFNTLAWLAFPKIKAAINARHYSAFNRREEAAETGRNRGAAQDAITLFDESGVIVVSSDDNLVYLLKTFQWKALFWEHRQQLLSSMKFIVLGHSLYEKALQPYTGMTGKGLVVPVNSAFFAKAVADQLAELDTRLSGYIADPRTLTSPRALCPVPLLGMPGWTPENESESYYDNTAYFRPGKSSDMPG